MEGKYRNKYFEGKNHDINELKELIHVLRDPDEGCSWDSVQTHESLEKCLRDETEEVIQAVNNKDDKNLCEELGDIFLEVLLHAEIAAERGAFTLDDVFNVLGDKLIRRHPHIFGDEPRPDTPEEALALWKKVKRIEKGEA